MILKENKKKTGWCEWMRHLIPKLCNKISKSKIYCHLHPCPNFLLKYTPQKTSYSYPQKILVKTQKYWQRFQTPTLWKQRSRQFQTLPTRIFLPLWSRVPPLRVTGKAVWKNIGTDISPLSYLCMKVRLILLPIQKWSSLLHQRKSLRETSEQQTHDTMATILREMQGRHSQNR